MEEKPGALLGTVVSEAVVRERTQKPLLLADVRGMATSSWDNVSAQLGGAGEGSAGSAACAGSTLFAG